MVHIQDRLRYWVKLVFGISLIAISASVQSQTFPQSKHIVFLTGNTADIGNIESFTSALKDLIERENSDWTLILNGDLVDTRIHLQLACSKIDSLLSPLSMIPNGEIVIIPGDRDWDEGKPMGMLKLNSLENYILSKKYPQVFFPLRTGCPGPTVFPLREDLTLLAINTQWWNHRHLKPTPETATCELVTEEAILEELEDLISDNTQGNLIIAGHYPVISNGPFGGSFPITDWFLPVPVINTMITSFKQNIGGQKEIVNEYYEDFREDLENILADNFSCIYASGHEYHHEILHEKENVFINSGAAWEGRFVKKKKNTVYASKEPGLIALHYYPDGGISAQVFLLRSGFFISDGIIQLYQGPCESPEPGIPINNRLIPCVSDEDYYGDMDLNYPDNIKIAANPNYTAEGMKGNFLGQHYRYSWTTQVTSPVLNLSAFAGGLVPYQIGGGRQTKSLKFKTSEGREYVFRSVDKDPSGVLSYDLRSTIISLAVRDQTTTQQPYGPIAASFLLDHLDLLHASPQLYVMPNDDQLGPFRSEFGGILGMVEERPVDRVQSKTFDNALIIKRSESLLRNIFNDPTNCFNTKEYVRTRVFDMLVGDWERSEDNWTWAGFRNGSKVEYRPIPRDRDHVFSLWDGFLPWLVDREWAKPAGENFDHTIKGLRSLMYQARHLDRFVTSEVDEKGWTDAAKFIQNNLNDSIINQAILEMPEEVYTETREIAEKLKTRLNDLDKYAVKYYKMLSGKVDVVGSNQREWFDVERYPDGRVSVKMFSATERGKDQEIYQRIFNPGETREIRLFGLQGNDGFEINGNSKSSIPIRVIPGPGIDLIIDSSIVKKGGKSTLVYDDSGTDQLFGLNEIKSVYTADREAYYYRRDAFKYNTYHPIVYLYYNSDNGISLNGGVTFNRQSYGKPDFSSRHQLAILLSTIGNIRFNYDGTFRHKIGFWDLVAGAEVEKSRRFRYFFGIGNETEYEKPLLKDGYYTLQYGSGKTYIGVQRSFWKQSLARIEMLYQYNGRQSLGNNILSSDPIDILGEETLHLGKAIAKLDFDFRDREHLPSRGSRFYAEYLIGLPLNINGKAYAVRKGTLEYFTTAMPFTLGLKAGGESSSGEVPYYDLPSLGQNRDLRGFRQNRFTAHAAAFLNTDLRIQLIDNQDALVPFKFGIRLFYDYGRVFVDDAKIKDAVPSTKWYSGYGAGIFFVPLRERFTINLSLAFSEEESGRILFRIGRSFQ